MLTFYRTEVTLNDQSTGIFKIERRQTNWQSDGPTNCVVTHAFGRLIKKEGGKVCEKRKGFTLNEKLSPT